MEILLFLSLVGALIGILAALRRGFSMAAGVVGGLILGPLAILMYFVPGAAGKDIAKCPFCAESIKAEATVRKHCHREVPAAVKAR